jgi:predicted TIM-barrel fold metal-dependent hydrolase
MCRRLRRKVIWLSPGWTPGIGFAWKTARKGLGPTRLQYDGDAVTRNSGAAQMQRREFLTGAVATAIGATRGGWAASQLDDIPIIDTHIHLFDGSRPQGAPYKGSNQYQGGIAMPSTYRALAQPLGIVGAIEIEASPWIEDNLWVLEVAQNDTIMVGTIGSLQPEKPEFAEYLERYHRNPLFRGIRYGNLWNYDLVRQLNNPVFIEGLKLLAQADLVLDTANPRVDLLQAIVTVSDKVANLRIVIDHLPSLDPGKDEQASYDRVLREIRGRPNIFVKLSEIDHVVDGLVVSGLAAHRVRLDLLVETFGEDRIIFGSDWPNSVGVATLGQIVELTRNYFATRPRVAEKYFWKNSLRAYKWVKRSANQPSMA